MKRKLFLVAMCIVVVAAGFLFITHNKDTATASQNVDYCFAMKADGKVETMLAVKPCTPSGWWCTSNSQCCSGSCRNNVCD
ncbi:conotoxin [Thermodesulfovibrio sp. TK110]